MANGFSYLKVDDEEGNVHSLGFLIGLWRRARGSVGTIFHSDSEKWIMHINMLWVREIFHETGT